VNGKERETDTGRDHTHRRVEAGGGSQQGHHWARTRPPAFFDQGQRRQTRAGRRCRKRDGRDSDDLGCGIRVFDQQEPRNRQHRSKRDRALDG